MTEVILNLDAELEDADWIKAGAWDLPVPPDQPALVRKWVEDGGGSWDAFLKLPVAQHLREPEAVSVVEYGVEGKSGHWGHAGRPGQVGGSADDGAPAAPAPVRIFGDASPEAKAYVRQLIKYDLPNVLAQSTAKIRVKGRQGARVKIEGTVFRPTGQWEMIENRLTLYDCDAILDADAGERSWAKQNIRWALVHELAHGLTSPWTYTTKDKEPAAAAKFEAVRERWNSLVSAAKRAGRHPGVDAYTASWPEKDAFRESLARVFEWAYGPDLGANDAARWRKSGEMASRYGDSSAEAFAGAVGEWMASLSGPTENREVWYTVR